MTDPLSPLSPDLQSVLSAKDVLALTMWGEARGESIEGRIAVGCVIRNRVRHGQFGADWKAVCLRPLQFSCWWKVGGAANQLSVLALAAQVGQTGGSHDDLWRECLFLAEGILTDQIGDRVGGATHYYETMSPPPLWTKGALQTTRVGRHLFFRNIV